MDIEVIYATEFGSSSTTMKIDELTSWIKRYNFKILSIKEQQQGYSEEEVIKFGQWLSEFNNLDNESEYVIKELLEQFKNK
jgi:hypothetical protein